MFPLSFHSAFVAYMVALGLGTHTINDLYLRAICTHAAESQSGVRDGAARRIFPGHAPLHK